MQAPSMDEWLEQAKQESDARLCGMYLTHVGVVRATQKLEVRENVEGLASVSAVDFSYDARGVQMAVEETLRMPGVYHVRTWLNEGLLSVGETLMCVMVGADIRPRCIEALEFLVERIKSELVIEREICSPHVGEE